MSYTRYPREEIDQNFEEDLDKCNPVLADDIREKASCDSAYRYIIHDTCVRKANGETEVVYDRRFLKPEINIESVSINLRKFVPFDYVFEGFTRFCKR